MSVAEPRTPETARHTVVTSDPVSSRKVRDGSPLAPVVLPIYLVVLAVAASAWAARGIGQSLWRDEAATASAATRTLPQLLHFLSRDDPALAAYYLFMHFWTGIFGSSEVALRVPSLIAVASAIVLIGLLAHRIAGPVAGAAAATLLVLAPGLVGTYAIQARPYGLVVALVTASALCALEISRGRRGTGLLVAWSVLAALAIAFEVLAAPAVLPQLIWLATSKTPGGGSRQSRRRILIALALPVLTGIAALYMAHRGSALQNWIPATSLHQVGVSAIGLVTLGGIVLIAASLPGLAVLARASRGTPWRPAVTDFVVAVAWAVLPFVVLVAYSVVIAPSFIPRYYLSAVPGATLVVALLVAGAVRGIRAGASRRLARVALPLVVVAAVVALALPVARHQLSVVKNEDLRGSAALIEHDYRPGDGIVYSPTYAESGLRWYFDDGRDSDGVPRDLLAKPGTTAIAAGSLWTPTEPASTSTKTIMADVDRVWIAGYKSYQPWTPVPDVGTPVAKAIEKCWTPGVTKTGTFSVELWTRPSGPAKPGCDF